MVIIVRTRIPDIEPYAFCIATRRRGICPHVNSSVWYNFRLWRDVLETMVLYIVDIRATDHCHISFVELLQEVEHVLLICLDNAIKVLTIIDKCSQWMNIMDDAFELMSTDVVREPERLQMCCLSLRSLQTWNVIFANIHCRFSIWKMSHDFRCMWEGWLARERSLFDLCGVHVSVGRNGQLFE